MRRTLALFNTLTRRVDPVVPILDGQISLYTCGPTVYNYAHIGNLRTFLFQDLLKRAFQAAGHEVRHCMNITDVEDKIIRDSQGALPVDASNAERHEAMTALTDRYTAIFLEDLDTLRIQRADFLPKATAYVPQMIRLIQALEAKGLAYVREGSVYYRIAGLPQYGCLAHLDRAGMQAGASVDADEYERDSITDFVLWKATKPGEPWWDSPWGPGRPGWHIECSAMGLELLGERVDIHSGGVDLIFPHHENEIAQSEGCLGHQWVNHWVHGEFLMVEGQKMAKSLGNFFTLRDLIDKGVDPLALRYAIQSNHYRKVLNFSFEGLRAAENSLKRIRAFRTRMEGEGQPGGGPWKEAVDPLARLEQAREAFWAAMADDLNTPEALAAIFTLVSDLNAQDDHVALSREERDAVVAFLDETDAIFSAWPQATDSLDAEVEALIEARRAAKVARNWAEADRVRDQLKALGIVLEDRKDGTTGWRRG
ncbi:MAG: cysteine--tRNA ligase [Geothrix sp.]|uniref:cysteine--tRNA ligase n=1 Tax=Geothrix sp. TaxID=1962974 RepID=UPI0017EB115B|nr:cysteine--tRNA ligase [Geothrix sp.]NWJ40166.1 cysteine--tRNA ligase [Geothrix sp.]WIL21826.1 MAG: cysteine--tRNA ligase [Geothrix sp.]